MNLISAVNRIFVKILLSVQKEAVRGRVRSFLNTFGLYRYIKNTYRSFITFIGTNGLKLMVSGVSARMIVSNPNELRLYHCLDNERGFLEKLLSRINSDTVFYDIGAHIGLYSLCVSGYKVKPKMIYSWEPEPFNFQRLQENIALNDADIKAFPIALGNKNTISQMSTDATEPGCLVAGFNRPASKSIAVKVARGDDWVRENTLYLPSIIKIDVEGYELNVLEGLENTIQKVKPVVFLEIHPDFLKHLGVSKEYILSFFHNMDYRVTFSSQRAGQEHCIFEYYKN